MSGHGLLASQSSLCILVAEITLSFFFGFLSTLRSKSEKFRLNEKKIVQFLQLFSDNLVKNEAKKHKKRRFFAVFPSLLPLYHLSTTTRTYYKPGSCSKSGSMVAIFQKCHVRARACESHCPIACLVNMLFTCTGLIAARWL